LKRLKGAYGRVTCVESRETHQQVYSRSNAGDLLAWKPPSSLDFEKKKKKTLMTEQECL
jgi:DNA excision repair protein ERCC-8